MHLVPLDLESRQQRHDVVDIRDTGDIDRQTILSVIEHTAAARRRTGGLPRLNLGIAVLAEHLLALTENHLTHIEDAFGEPQAGVDEGRHIRFYGINQRME